MFTGKPVRILLATVAILGLGLLAKPVPSARSCQEQQVYLPLVTKDYIPPPEWSNLMTDDFEGNLSRLWQLSYSGSSSYLWGKSGCKPFAGSNSAWAVGGGQGGKLLQCSTYYPNQVDSWMIAGPFDLSGASAAELRFELWMNTQNDEGKYNDSLSWIVSRDGENFYGSALAGSYPHWQAISLNLADVTGDGALSFLGEPRVWVAFRFHSDAEVHYRSGVFIDEVALRKCTGAACQAPPPGGSLPVLPVKALARP